MEKNINTIFVDLGDTLRVIRKDREYERAAKAVITACLGVDTDPEEFYQNVIEPRYAKYREWALTYYCEAPVEVLWTRWLAYDFPEERVRAHAAEMTWAYRRTKGERVVTDGGAETIKELYRRGYTIAIVSDLVGVEEVDDWLDRDGLRPYFHKYVFHAASNVEFALAALGNDAGAYGAFKLALDAYGKKK